MKSKARFVCLVLSAVAVLLAGCQKPSADGREVHEVAGKRITVIDNPEPAYYEDSALDALVQLNNVRGMDWLGDNEIIITRDNTDFPPEHAEGIDWYPQNLYAYELSSGDQEPLLPENANQGFALLSPDRTKLFYKTFDLQANTGKGYIMDLATRSTFAFTSNDEMVVQYGNWIDNETVVYSTLEGVIMFAYLNRSYKKVLLNTGAPFSGNNIAFLDDRLFYTTLKGELFAHSLKAQPAALPIRNVVWMVPSPDEKRLAIVQRLAGGNMELVITDLQGRILNAIAQDSQIFGVAWSPDGTKLAYAGFTPNGTVRGIYVADTSTGLSAPLPVDVRFIGDPLRWSPSGNRLMITETQSPNRVSTFLVKVP